MTTLFLSHITLIPWLILPFVSRKSRYFYFYLILGISGLYQLSMFYIYRDYMMLLMMPFSIMLIPSLYRETFNNRKLLIIIFFFVLVAFSAALDHETNNIIALLAFIIILVILSYQVTLDLINNNKLDMVSLILIVYQLSLVIKYIPLIKDFTTGLTYFYFNTIFQMFAGILLIFVKEDNPKLTIKLKEPD